MKTEEFIALMNEDLKREYQHMLFYLHTSALVKGLHRHEVGEFLFEEAQSELKHVREFSDMILSVYGYPALPRLLTEELPQFPEGSISDILGHVLKMEQEVVTIFSERLKQSEEIPGYQGQLLHIFYEDQIMDSHKTVHEVQMMLQKG
jgi:ferritin